MSRFQMSMRLLGRTLKGTNSQFLKILCPTLTYSKELQFFTEFVQMSRHYYKTPYLYEMKHQNTANNLMNKRF